MWSIPTIFISPAADASGDLWELRSSGMDSKTQQERQKDVRTVQRTVRTSALQPSLFLNAESKDGANRK